MTKKTNVLEVILVHLLGKKAASQDLRRAIEQAALDPDLQSEFDRLEALLSWQEDPDWLEVLAAARDGVMVPEMADFLADREALAHLAPELIRHFEAMLAPATEEDAADLALPSVPTFAQQATTRAQQPTPAPPDREDVEQWRIANGFEWRQLKERGRIFIRLLAEAFRPPAAMISGPLQPATVPAASTGRRRGKGKNSLFALELQEEIDDLELKVTAKAKPDDPERSLITVEVNIPSRGGWPHLGGAEVILKQNDRKLNTQLTDAYGRAYFEDIAQNILPGLVFEIVPQPFKHHKAQKD